MTEKESKAGMKMKAYTPEEGAAHAEEVMAKRAAMRAN